MEYRQTKCVGLATCRCFHSSRKMSFDGHQQVTSRGVDQRHLHARLTTVTTGEPMSVRRTAPQSNVLRLYNFQAFRALGLRRRDLAVNIRLPRPGLSASNDQVVPTGRKPPWLLSARDSGCERSDVTAERSERIIAGSARRRTWGHQYDRRALADRRARGSSIRELAAPRSDRR